MADDSQMPSGVSVDRTGERPVRKDTRSLMEMLRDEFNHHLGAKERKVGMQGQGLDEAVDEAVKGAPAPGSEEY